MNFVVLRSRHFHHRIMNENEDETRFNVQKKWNIRTTVTPLSVVNSPGEAPGMYVARSEAQTEENITKRARHSFVVTTQPKGKLVASGWQGLLSASNCPVDEDSDRIR